VPEGVQFYRNVAADSPYAAVQSAPPAGNPPDACGAYVMANLPNDVVSLVHVADVPSYPTTGGPPRRRSTSDQYEVQFSSDCG
jgi:hypothetical protein